MFWSSVELTGNQTKLFTLSRSSWFWSSVELTGNQTGLDELEGLRLFWSSVKLTGNQTRERGLQCRDCFGAVSN